MQQKQPTAIAGGLRLLIIDRYLLRQFVQTFLICFCSLTGLYVVIDAFTNLEEFITYSRDHGSLVAVIGEYYGYRVLSFFDTTSHIMTLIAAMFTVTWIQRHNELTALEAAGIPKGRIIKPLIATALVIVLLKVANRELVIPSVREKLSHNAQDLGGSRGKDLVPRYDFRTGVLLRSSGQAFANELRIDKPDFQMPRGLNRYGPRLIAEYGYYKPPEGDRPGGYLLTGVSEPEGLDGEASLSLSDGQPVLLTPQDHDWLKPRECFVVSEVSFEYLAADSNWRQLSSTYELIQGLTNRSLDYGASERTAIHSRMVQPVLDITLLFLGLPMVLSRSNRNVFLAIGLCLVLVVAFMLVVMACRYLGSGYWLEPSLAAWLPLMIFVPCAVALSQPLRE
ncbi:MAG: YjgP/YjgQ family permease [Planctomycetota bacterium]|nr:MAG: YjgP/YjgQ family permease [Planctomycetota bacterium]